MYSPKPIRGPEIQLSKSRSTSVPATLNANEFHLSKPALPATRPSHREDAAYASGIASDVDFIVRCRDSVPIGQFGRKNRS